MVADKGCLTFLDGEGNALYFCSIAAEAAHGAREKIMSVLEMPRVSECSVAGCSYNHDGCTAYAVSVGQDAQCATFVPLNVKGGLDKVIAKVGACQRSSCRFNQDLECSADFIRVGGAEADCLSYEAR
jgi:hypothetical protein